MHNIHYIVTLESEKKDAIMAEIRHHASMDGDGYSSHMTWHDNVKPFDSEEEAMEFIKNEDNGWYDDHAVRFLDYSNAKETRKIEELRAKAVQLGKDEHSYREAHSIHNFKAKHIGCPNCESKLNKDYINGEKCPLCRTDLRGKTTLEKLEWYSQKKCECYAKIETEMKKQKDKAVVKWLVKYEYHS